MRLNNSESGHNSTLQTPSHTDTYTGNSPPRGSCPPNTQVRTLSFSPGGDFLAAASYDHVMDISSVSTGKRVCKVDTGCGINQVAWQPKAGSTLVAFGRDAKSESRAREGEAFLQLLALPNLPS